MKNFIPKFFRRRRPLGGSRHEIAPDEILIDSSNLPKFDTHHFEGRFEKPITARTIFALSAVFLLCGGLFFSRLWILQINRGEAYSVRSENNRLRFTDIFANRGVIFDRNGVALASNKENDRGGEFPLRTYKNAPGLSHVVGYLKYPTKDANGFYYRKSFAGQDGVESTYSDFLSGENGLKIVETDALGNIQSESASRVPKDGNNMTLTIDARLQSKIYELMKEHSERLGFSGGAAVIMDVNSGELLVLTSFPEYDSALLTEGDQDALNKYLNDKSTPFLNRAVSGLYTPGSIIKPILALAALEEGIISPAKQILSTGSISVPNPYFPGKKTIFLDWKEHGYTDMRRALAVSSNVYFYTIGGGHGDQKGLGIEKIEKYVRLFGFGEKTGIRLLSEQESIIPNPAWKEKVFDGDPWRIGDTYNSAIGQYGFQVTPIQVVRYVSAIANGGTLLTPTLVPEDMGIVTKSIKINQENLKIVREGMRLAVLEGTASGLNIPSVEVAAKTGTAELGAAKQLVNSWSIGFFPYENPHYAFAVLMERGPRQNTVGATSVMRQFLDWLAIYEPQYLGE